MSRQGCYDCAFTVLATAIRESAITLTYTLADENAQERIKDESPAARATVISAIRYTFAESTRSYDDLLGSMIIDFLSLITDTDLVRARLTKGVFTS